MLEINRIYEGDNIKLLPNLSDNIIDLTLTSPPYDHLRDYEGFDFNFKGIVQELYRVTKEGGVVVWVVGDATVKGNETGTSFTHALFFKKIGFNLHDTMIYRKGGQGAVGSNNSYWQDFEYMFVFTKGKIKTFNPIKDRKNITTVRKKKEKLCMGHRRKDGTKKGTREIQRTEYGKRFNIWTYHESGTRESHSAVFPKQLAYDHIISWSNKEDLVLDPMCGSGTTCKIAQSLERNYIGMEISPKYCEMSRKAIFDYHTNLNWWAKE